MDRSERKITKIAREVSAFTVQTMKAEGIGTAEFDFIHLVRHNPGITQAELRERLKIDKGAAARRASSLEAKGYLVRQANPNDGRSQLLYATEQAEGLKNSKAHLEAVFYEWLLSTLSEKEREAFLATLDTLYLRAKQESVLDAFRRIGGLEVPVLDILPSPEVDRYRNKVQFPVGVDKNGAPCIGFYAGRTHRIVPCPDCKLQPGVLNEIGNALCAFFAQQGIRPYDEQIGKGLVRHIFLRRGAHSGQIMVCLVCTRAKLPHAEQLCTALREQFPAISTILLNVNAKNTNVILGSENHILYGPGYIEDSLCGVPVRLGPLSFYQVNTLAAERLYGVAAQYAQLAPDDTLLDLYCGMGTIGLSMADQCRELIGVEIVPEAIESAKANAARMGEAVAAKSRFFCADAGQAATQLATEGLHPDIVMLDPPRKGCDEATLSAVVRMAPRRVVYVSCNPATAARDAAWLEKNGYHAEKVQPVDLFPRTKHVECVIVLSKGTGTASI